MDSQCSAITTATDNEHIYQKICEEAMMLYRKSQCDRIHNVADITSVKIHGCTHGPINFINTDGGIDRDGKTPLKRLRLDPETNFKQKDSDPENELSSFQYSEWDELPYVALVEIYKCLSNQDRFSLSLTCKAWSQPFSQPEIWRYVKFRFDGIEDWRARRFVGPLALGVRHLEIDFQSARDVNCRSLFDSLTYLYDFLDGMIKCGNCKLVTIKLVNMACLYLRLQWYKDRDIMQVLGEFLSIQTNLKMLDLSRAGFNENQGNYLLSKIAPTLGANISCLDINDLYYSKQVLPQINTCLQAFTNLTELSINYEFLPDDLLSALAASGSLKRMKVFAYKELDFSPPISQTWEKLKTSCPSLEAHYHIHEKLGSLETLMSILTPGIPLVSLEFSLVAPCSDWPDVCTYIIDNFKNHLRSLTTEICDYTVSKDPTLNAINSIIESCQSLEVLSIKDTIDLFPDQYFIMKSINEAIIRQPCCRIRIFTFSACQEFSDACVQKKAVERFKSAYLLEQNKNHFRPQSR